MQNDSSLLPPISHAADSHSVANHRWGCQAKWCLQSMRRKTGIQSNQTCLSLTNQLAEANEWVSKSFEWGMAYDLWVRGGWKCLPECKWVDNHVNCKASVQWSLFYLTLSYISHIYLINKFRKLLFVLSFEWLHSLILL